MASQRSLLPSGRVGHACLRLEDPRLVDFRRRAIRARNDAAYLIALRQHKRPKREDAGVQPLSWAAAHPLIIDDHGGAYHRVWCFRVDDQDGTTGQHVAEGEPLPHQRGIHACPHCRPELVLRE